MPRQIRPTAFVLGLLLVATTRMAAAMTVEGRVDTATGEMIVVDGTRFMVDGETVVQTSPASPEATSPYATGFFDDVYKVRVTSTGRLAERVVILPYGYGEPATGEGQERQ